MYSIPLEKIYEKISSHANLPVSEIKEKVKAKLQQLSGLVSEEGAAHIIANEFGVKLFEAPGLLKISQVVAGMRNIDIQGRVVKKYEMREFSTKDGRQGKVANFLLGDETGVVRVVLWNSSTENFDKLTDGLIVKLSNVLVKENRNLAEIHVNDSSVITLNPAGVSISVKVRQEQDIEQAARKYIQDLQENDMNVALLGTIVQVFDIKFFEVCPDCNKRARESLQGFVCPTHNVITPVINYVVSLILDDGTGTIRVTCWKQQTQTLLKKPHEEIVLYRENPSGFEEVKMALLGTIVKIAGKVNKNATFDRIEFVAQSIDLSPNPEEELKILMDSHLSPKAPVPELKSKPTTLKEQEPQQSYSEELFDEDA